ncbi:MAG: aspartate aminotransferase family protein [Opitutales bacterium]
MDASTYSRCLLGNYAPPEIAIVRGQGSRVWDDAGNEYLDMGAGIAVSSLGHAHPKWVEAVSTQAATLAHCTNLYAIPAQAELAERLVAKAGPGKMMFCNSGAEANETLLKLARLHGRMKSGEEGKIFQVVCAEDGFHGRTFGGMSATGQEKVRKGFAPLVDGFSFARLNDFEDFATRVNGETAAVLLEPIQGESGIKVANDEFLRSLRHLCDERGVLLMLDEVQCGMGRTGDFFAFERSGIRPDAIAMAKGLGGGFPIGAVWIGEEHADLFEPGSHGSTVGGGPVACRAALAVLDVIEEENLLARATEHGAWFRARLDEVVEAHSEVMAGTRGRGLMIGLPMHVSAFAFADGLRKRGLLTVPAGGEVVRFLPPLNVSRPELEKAADIVASLAAEWNLNED